MQRSEMERKREREAGRGESGGKEVIARSKSIRRKEMNTIRRVRKRCKGVKDRHAGRHRRILNARRTEKKPQEALSCSFVRRLPAYDMYWNENEDEQRESEGKKGEQRSWPVQRSCILRLLMPLPLFLLGCTVLDICGSERRKCVFN